MDPTNAVASNGWTIYLQHVSPIVSAVLWLLVGLSFLTWFLIAYKALEFWRAHRADRLYAERFWSTKAVLSANTGVTPHLNGPCSRLTESGLQVVQRYREQFETGRGEAGTLAEAVTRAIRQAVQDSTIKLEAGLGVLATVGNSAPFIGLFGTVVGIMSALKDISQTGAAGLDVVAGPIGEALIATAAGLACAIPAVVAYNGFVRRLRVHVNRLNGFGQELLGQILAEIRTRDRAGSGSKE
ncbi:MAG TPA: MotA/TolQ/ExbB proton channel family protein [Nitrospiria bacterium]|nr:MotA/TolQ/ExbB proton channel family protein [Nitrospiria bacterium]